MFIASNVYMKGNVGDIIAIYIIKRTFDKEYIYILHDMSI